MNGIIERFVKDAPQPHPHVRAPDRTIGTLLLEDGKLKAGDAERALRLAKDTGIRFGEACVQLKIVSPQDVESALARQFDYPYLRSGQANLSEELVAAFDPFSMQVEALRALRTQLLLRWFNADRKILAVVSPQRADGRSYLAANLAIVFSQLGERTLLIDADMRGARQHRIFNLPNRYGLSALLAGRSHGDAIVPIEEFNHLAVVPAGATPPNPLELVSRPEFKDLLASECQRFDIVLVDTPAAEMVSDAQTIVARTGGALAVAREGRARVSGLARLAQSIQGTQAELVGCVLNRY